VGHLEQTERVRVELGINSYDIVIGAGILPLLGQELADLAKLTGWGKQVLVISNPTVEALYGEQIIASIAQAGFQTTLALVQDGERYKSMDSAMELYNQALSMGLDRKSLIVALGGGVVGDLAGFVASTYMRGIPFVQVPTTLLAQVDSSVGGKVAVNHPKGKNIIGSFYQPRLVWADVEVLKTLPMEELRAGLAEVIKYGIIWDEGFFNYLEQSFGEILSLNQLDLRRIVRKSCAIKANIVAQDEREGGIRAILNLGHTFGHALEALTNYQVYRHGEAVAVGMVMACKVSRELDLMTVEELNRVSRVIKSFGLPVEDRKVGAEDILNSMYHDKKAEAGRIKYIIPETIGQVRISSEIPEELILRILLA
jgi:3-dehydroquinate synthase